MRVLIIPEDQHHDQYIVKPVIERVFSELALPAEVRVLPEPRLRGASDALNVQLVGQIISDNQAMVDLFVLVIDRDCNRDKHEAKAASMEQRFSESLVACLAVEEIETWMLALHKATVESLHSTSWKEIRSHCDPKEAYAIPFLETLGSDGPGGGRKAAMRSITGSWRSLRTLCPEIDALVTRLREKLVA